VNRSHLYAEHLHAAYRACLARTVSSTCQPMCSPATSATTRPATGDLAAVGLLRAPSGSTNVRLTKPSSLERGHDICIEPVKTVDEIHIG